MRRPRRTKFNDQAKAVVEYLISEHDMTVTQIAEICQVDKSFISRCKNGERELSYDHLDRLSLALDVVPGALLFAAMPMRVPHRNPRLRELHEQCVALLNAASPGFQKPKKRKRDDGETPPTSAAA
ncbi:MAG: helix-turn-helix transcriptional regulator [Planctomycetota bacterium]